MECASTGDKRVYSLSFPCFDPWWALQQCRLREAISLTTHRSFLLRYRTEPRYLYGVCIQTPPLVYLRSLVVCFTDLLSCLIVGTLIRAERVSTVLRPPALPSFLQGVIINALDYSHQLGEPSVP